MSDRRRGNLRVSRRQVLAGGSLACTVAVAGMALPHPARAAEEADRFMRMSGLLVNHRLDPAFGAAILDHARQHTADWAQLCDRITGRAEARGARTVEEFFDDIPAGPEQDFARWVILAWYSGCSGAGATATLFSYEKALAFQTTIDMAPIPSYGRPAPMPGG